MYEPVFCCFLSVQHFYSINENKKVLSKLILKTNCPFILNHACNHEDTIKDIAFVSLLAEIRKKRDLIFIYCLKARSYLSTITMMELDSHNANCVRNTKYLEMITKPHLFVSIRQTDLPQLVIELESKLPDIYIDSKSNKQTSITDFCQRI